MPQGHRAIARQRLRAGADSRLADGLIASPYDELIHEFSLASSAQGMRSDVHPHASTPTTARRSARRRLRGRQHIRHGVRHLRRGRRRTARRCPRSSVLRERESGSGRSVRRGGLDLVVGLRQRRLRRLSVSCSRVRQCVTDDRESAVGQGGPCSATATCTPRDDRVTDRAADLPDAHHPRPAPLAVSHARLPSQRRSALLIPR